MSQNRSPRMPVTRFVLTVIGIIAAMLVSATIITNSGGVSLTASESSEAIALTNPAPFGPTDLVLNEWVVLLGLLIVILITIVVIGGLLAFAFTRLANTTKTALADDKFKTHTSNLEQQRKQQLAELKRTAPPGPIPDHEGAEASWTRTSSLLKVGLIFAPLIGAAFSLNFQEGESMLNMAMAAAIITLLGGFALLSSRRAPQPEGRGDASLTLSATLYIVLTGAIMLGLGIGVMMWVRAAG